LDVKNSSIERDFDQIKAQHIYRIYNKEADEMSKEALLLEEDGIFYAEEHDGHTSNFERLEY
jgi:hypothetical protein